jgi:outer membrane receptor protein involved in Fe transport/uncharacterized protein with beta-barrel porin domain
MTVSRIALAATSSHVCPATARTGAISPYILAILTALFTGTTRADAACTTDINGNAICTGAVTTPLTIYDPAAAFQPVNGGNAYVPANPNFPATSNPNNPGYNPAPPTVTVTLTPTASFSVVNPATSFLADKGLIVANFSNNENPPVNNVVINNGGTVSLTTNQIASRIDAIVGDSQVNSFTVNNSGSIAITQNFFGSTFSAAKLNVAASGTLPTYAATYNGATLNDMAALYSDDNTNSFVINNAAAGKILATGNFATVYYGRADTTLTNSGIIGNSNWRAGDSIAAGHWAIATWAGADFEALPGTNPDSPFNIVSNIARNTQGNLQGTIVVTDTSATTMTNNVGGIITGDILAIDTTPLVYAAAIASGNTLPLASSGTNAGPRDSVIENAGTISGNIYLGSGTHMLDNAAGATIAGNINVDQRASIATFSVADIYSTNPTLNGTPLNGEPAAGQLYLSAGGSDFASKVCSAAGASTLNAGCAKTTKVLATYVGGQSLTLTNEGTLTGNITLNDQPSSVNAITLTGTGFTGSVIALNGTGQNALTLNGVASLASIQNFSALDLQSSNVATSGGASLVSGATLSTTIYGAGGSSASPSMNLGNISGTLTLAGATSIVPTLTAAVRNGDVYQLASRVVGAGNAAVDFDSALVSFSATTGPTGALLLGASVANPASLPGISQAGAQTLSALLGYGGSNFAVQTLGAAAESIVAPGDVRLLAEHLRPDVSAGSDRVLIDTAAAMQHEVDQRIDGATNSATNPLSRLWMTGFGLNGEGSAGKGIDGYSADAGGVVAGADYPVADTIRLGGALGYAKSAIRNSGVTQGDHTNVDSYRGMVYGALQGSPWQLNGSFAVATNDYTTKRLVDLTKVGGTIETDSAAFSGTQYTVRAAGAYPIAIPFGSVSPIASLTYNYIDRDAYAETSTGISGLTYGSNGYDSIRSGLGIKLGVPLPTDDYTTAIDLHAVWSHEFADTVPVIGASFGAGSAAFIANGAPLGREIADLGVGFHLSSSDASEKLSIGYNVELADRYVSQSVLLKASFLFGNDPMSEAEDTQPSSSGVINQTMQATLSSQARTLLLQGGAQNDNSVAPGAPRVQPQPLVVPPTTREVIIVTPLDGKGLDLNDVTGGVTRLNADDIARQASQNIVDTLLQRVPSIVINSETGNDFEPDVQFRGFVATSLSGVPEGLAVYQNGVRVNEAFGDNVHWDFIPTLAIDKLDVLSNNPIFGLNALGGSINLQMKNGFTFQGLDTDIRGGSFGRVQNSTEWGRQFGNYSIYIATEVARDEGWRDFSPSTIRRIYGDLGYRGEQSEFHLNLTGADNDFGAAATTPIQLVSQKYGSVFTTPQSDHSEMGMISLQGKYEASDTLTFNGTAYYRRYIQHHVDGNGTDAQPCDADATLLCFNDGVSQANGTNGHQLANPFSAPATPGEIDLNNTRTNGFGGTIQATETEKILGFDNNLVAGVSLDIGRTNFGANAELGVIQPNFVVVGTGIYLGASGNPISDGPVALLADNTYIGGYVLDTLDLTSRLSVTGGARFNSSQINLNDQLNAAGSANSLTGSHYYTHFNPVLGGTFKVTRDVTAYAGFSEANRAPTPLELGCANPQMPCIIDSFLVSDPNLKQVVSRTFEGGFRGKIDLGHHAAEINWSLGVYRTDNSDDILNIPSPLNNGFGYFDNVGSTRRQGIEAEVDFRDKSWFVSLSYAYVDATYRSGLSLAAPGGDPFADANGNIAVAAGDHISSIPPQRVKLAADYAVTSKWKIGGDLQLVSSQYYGGDEANQNAQLPAYATVNIRTSYQLFDNVQIYGLIDNLFDHHYDTYGTFFDNSSYVGNRSFPSLTDTRTIAPGKPISGYVGVKISY